MGIDAYPDTGTTKRLNKMLLEQIKPKHKHKFEVVRPLKFEHYTRRGMLTRQGRVERCVICGKCRLRDLDTGRLVYK